jgi:hypothetical protein
MNTQIPPSVLGDVGRIVIDVDHAADRFVAYASWVNTDDDLYDAKATAFTIDDAVNDAIDALDSDNESRPRP